MIRKLSARHQEIIRLVASGYANKDIAQALGIAESTAKNHLTKILAETGAVDRLQLAVLAFKWGILSVDEAYATMLATFDLERKAAEWEY